MKYVLDTHVWVWWNMSPAKVSRKVSALLGDFGNYDELLLSVISPWEFCKLLEKKRIAVSCNPESWVKEALNMPKLRLVQLTPQISYRSTVLPQPFHSDPSDQIIVATAREENATLITKDELIINYPHVRTVW